MGICNSKMDEYTLVKLRSDINDKLMNDQVKEVTEYLKTSRSKRGLPPFCNKFFNCIISYSLKELIDYNNSLFIEIEEKYNNDNISEYVELSNFYTLIISGKKNEYSEKGTRFNYKFIFEDDNQLDKIDKLLTDNSIEDLYIFLKLINVKNVSLVRLLD